MRDVQRWSNGLKTAVLLGLMGGLILAAIVADKYEALGEERVKPLFGPDHTHTSPAGAEFNAAAVVAGLKGLKGNPFKKYFSPRAKEVAASRPAQLK